METIKKHFFLGIIFFINLFFAIYFCNQKKAWYADEGLTYVHSNSLSPFSSAENLPHDCSERYKILTSHFTARTDHRFEYKQIWENLLTHPPLYYILIHTISSFFPDVFSKWFGLSLNLIFFITTQFLLYSLGLHVFKDRYKSLLPVIFYGFSVPAVSTLAYIRAYMLLTMFTVLMFLIFLKYIETVKIHPETSYAMLWQIFLVLIAGGLTHYYFFVTSFCACAFVCFFLLYHKKLLSLSAFAGTALSAVAGCFLIFRPMTSHILNSERGFSRSILPMLSKFNIDDMFRMPTLNKIIKLDLFFPLDINFTMFFLCAGVCWGGFRYLKNNCFSDGVFFLSVVTAGTCFLLNAIVPIQIERYFFSIIPLIIFLSIVLVNDVIEKLFGNKSYLFLLAVIITLCVLNIKEPYFRLYLKTAKDSDGFFSENISNKTLLTHWFKFDMFELGLYTFAARNTIIYTDENDSCYLETVKKNAPSELALLTYRNGECPQYKGWTIMTQGEICGYLKKANGLE